MKLCHHKELSALTERVATRKLVERMD